MIMLNRGIRYLFLLLVIGQTIWCVIEQQLFLNQQEEMVDDINNNDIIINNLAPSRSRSFLRFGGGVVDRFRRRRREGWTRKKLTTTTTAGTTNSNNNNQTTKTKTEADFIRISSDSKKDDEKAGDDNKKEDNESNEESSDSDSEEEMTDVSEDKEQQEQQQQEKDLEKKFINEAVADLEKNDGKNNNNDDMVEQEKKKVRFELDFPAQIDLSALEYDNMEDDEIIVDEKTNETYVVFEDDVIMRRARSQPIIIPEYKLVFFHVAKVASTAFIMMFQTLLNITDPKTKINIHHPYQNGLQYLNPRKIAYANKVIQDPTWTKAIFVRNPHERLISAYLDKGATSFAWIQWSCCPKTMDCMRADGNHTFEDFIELLPNCSDVHWLPQHYRFEPKYWKYMNFVGHMENLESDSTKLLKRIGAWDKYLEMKKEQKEIYYDSHTNNIVVVNHTSTNNTTNSSSLFNSYGQHHATNARKRKMKQYFTNPTLYNKVTQYYKDDYNNPVMGLSVKPYDEL